jgi:hypothetical protein
MPHAQHLEILLQAGHEEDDGEAAVADLLGPAVLQAAHQVAGDVAQHDARHQHAHERRHLGNHLHAMHAAVALLQDYSRMRMMLAYSKGADASLSRMRMVPHLQAVQHP